MTTSHAYNMMKWYFRHYIREYDEFKELTYDEIEEIFNQMLEHVYHLAECYL